MTPHVLRRRPHPASVAIALALLLPIAACGAKVPTDRVRVSGYVEATEIQVAAEVGGRILDLNVAEGDRVEVGKVIAQLDTADAQLALTRAQADARGADAQLRLLLAGPRVEELRQADAQRAAADADLSAARDDVTAAERDLKRYESLIAANAGAEKPRDDAKTRRDVANMRVKGAEERLRAATEVLNRLMAGARREEIDGARARLAYAEAQIATIAKGIRDATVHSPAAGVVTQKLMDKGEIVAPRVPIIAVADVDNVWANVFLDEPLVPRVTLGQAVKLYPDGGGAAIDGKLTFISSKAEFTPRNVQTAAERSKLVFRLKVTVDNRKGVLKQGMPVEAEIVYTK